MSSYPPLVYSREIDKDELARARARGELVRLATGIYTSETDKPVEDVVRQRLRQIVARVMPGAVIVDRSVRDGGRGSGGTLYLVSNRRRDLMLPGVRVVSRAGAGPQPTDMRLPDGLYMSGLARALLENLAPTRKMADGTSRTLTRAEVEIWINELAGARGDGYLNRLRDEAKELVPVLAAENTMPLLDALISATLLTNDRVASPAPGQQLHRGHRVHLG